MNKKKKKKNKIKLTFGNTTIMHGTMKGNMFAIDNG